MQQRRLCQDAWCGWVHTPLLSTHGPPLCRALWFWEVRWIWKLHGKFLISPLRSDNISPHPSISLCLVTYLAVKTNDLCTIFTLEFMCYSDKVCGPVCTSAHFMSVYWDHRLPTGGHKTLFRGNAKSHQFPIHSLSPAFPYEWWILSSLKRTTWPFTANNRNRNARGMHK